MKPAEWIEILRYFSLVTGIGVVFTVSVWLGWLLGSALENLLGGLGWMVAGLLAGVVAGFLAVYSMLTKFLPRE